MKQIIVTAEAALMFAIITTVATIAVVFIGSIAALWLGIVCQ